MTTKQRNEIKKYWTISVTEKHINAFNIFNVDVKLTRSGKYVDGNLNENDDTRKIFALLTEYANTYIVKK
jgi:hypothetical protein